MQKVILFGVPFDEPQEMIVMDGVGKVVVPCERVIHMATDTLSFERAFEDFDAPFIEGVEFNRLAETNLFSSARYFKEREQG